jgi:hypothetical protein
LDVVDWSSGWMMMNMEPGDKLVLAHYEHRWGKPTKVHSINAPQLPEAIRPLLVGEYSLPADGLTIYGSIGMSRAPMTLSPESIGHRAEIFIGSFQSFSSLPDMLAMIAAYPHISNTLVTAEHTIPLGQYIVDGSGMSSIILCPPYFDPPEFRRIEASGYHVEVLWVIPIYESERQFKIKRGWQVLRQIFQEKNVAIGDLFRQPAF